MSYPYDLTEMLQSILDTVCDCLIDSPLGQPADCFISHNPPPDDCCLAAETEVVTSEGVYPIGSLAGRTVSLMTSGGEWVEAPVRSFGVQSLMKVTLTRNSQEKVIFATPDHRWILEGPTRPYVARKRIERTTKDLRSGDVLASERGTAWDEVDPKGVAAGIIYGDGTATPWGSRVMLYGLKAQLAGQVSLFGHEVAGDARHGGSRGFSGFPNEWKNLPDVDQDRSFLLGWLVGYMSTDGSVSSKAVRLGSASRLSLERVREICYRLGIVTSEIQEQWRKGYGEEETPLFSISLIPSSLPDGFFVRPDQILAFNPSTRSVPRWRVVSVEASDRIEEVFCASVPDTRSFVLAGNILTGNCDYATVWVEEIRPSHGFVEATYQTGGKLWDRCCSLGRVVDIGIRWVRDCYPVVVDDARNPFPLPADMQAAAEYLLTDARLISCCLPDANCDGVLLGADTCLEVGWGEMIPYGPLGGCAGWTWHITVELESCGCLPSNV